MNVAHAEVPNRLVQIQRGREAFQAPRGIPAIQAQRAVPMLAQGNALGQAWRAYESPNGATLLNCGKGRIDANGLTSRSAPLGLKNRDGNRLPRPMAWADVRMARWAGTHTRSTRTHLRSPIPAIQAQRAASMSALGNALGLAQRACPSPNGAALIKMKGF